MSTTVIAIDGPAGAGKSTIAREVAGRLDFTYIDTGAMYRAVALLGSRRGLSFDDVAELERLALTAEIEFLPERRIVLNGEDVTEVIRTTEISSAASKVAALGPVRAALVAQQRRMAESLNVVMEGRDIGTVVFPDAKVKVFLDAAPEERARRRAGEFPGIALEELARQIAERDNRDRNRAESPLVQASGAIALDTTGLAIDQVVNKIVEIVLDRKEDRT